MQSHSHVHRRNQRSRNRHQQSTYSRSVSNTEATAFSTITSFLHLVCLLLYKNTKNRPIVQKVESIVTSTSQIATQIIHNVMTVTEAAVDKMLPPVAVESQQSEAEAQMSSRPNQGISRHTSIVVKSKKLITTIYVRAVARFVEILKAKVVKNVLVQRVAKQFYEILKRVSASPSAPEIAKKSAKFAMYYLWALFVVAENTPESVHEQLPEVDGQNRGESDVATVEEHSTGNHIATDESVASILTVETTTTTGPVDLPHSESNLSASLASPDSSLSESDTYESSDETLSSIDDDVAQEASKNEVKIPLSPIKVVKLEGELKMRERKEGSDADLSIASPPQIA
ncbi:hypothetical protein BKA69DRAFT_1066010 [Paraphysoderma sedebokerense]|nr:hypothetical protein BKA69DRAFT_1066010 [Paraphysoderma sedebokerense]